MAFVHAVLLFGCEVKVDPLKKGKYKNRWSQRSEEEPLGMLLSNCNGASTLGRGDDCPYRHYTSREEEGIRNQDRGRGEMLRVVARQDRCWQDRWNNGGP